MMYINRADLQATLVIYIANIFLRYHYDDVIFRKIHPMERCGQWADSTAF